MRKMTICLTMLLFVNLLLQRSFLVFQDTDGGLTLDLKEVSPFYHYAFARVFGVSLDREHTDALFHLMDMDANSEVQFWWVLHVCMRDSPYCIVFYGVVGCLRMISSRFFPVLCVFVLNEHVLSMLLFFSLSAIFCTSLFSWTFQNSSCKLAITIIRNQAPTEFIVSD